MALGGRGAVGAGRMTSVRHDPLPPLIRSLFWDLDPRALRWERDREQIIGRVLASGSWDAVTWLRNEQRQVWDRRTSR